MSATLRRGGPLTLTPARAELAARAAAVFRARMVEVNRRRAARGVAQFDEPFSLLGLAAHRAACENA